MTDTQLIQAVRFLVFNEDRTARGDTTVRRPISTSINTKITEPYFTKINCEKANEIEPEKFLYTYQANIDKKLKIKTHLLVWNKAYQFLVIFQTKFGDFYSYSEGTSDVDFLQKKCFFRFYFTEGEGNELSMRLDVFTYFKTQNTDIPYVKRGFLFSDMVKEIKNG